MHKSCLKGFSAQKQVYTDQRRNIKEQHTMDYLCMKNSLANSQWFVSYSHFHDLLSLSLSLTCLVQTPVKNINLRSALPS